MKQSQTSWMSRERIWHEIDIYSQGEANVLGYGLQAHPFSCKIGLFLLILLFFTPVVSLGYLIVCRASSLSTWILPRRAHLSVVIGSARHKESSVCLDENVDGRDVMRAKGTLRHRGCVLDVLRLSVPHQGLWGVLSVTKDFNFPLPPFASSFICRAAEVLQSPLNHHSPFAQYIWITRNKITTPALLQSYFFSFLFLSPRLKLSQLCLSWFPRGESETSSKVFTAHQTRSGPVGLQVKPQCHPVATTCHYSSQYNCWNHSWDLQLLCCSWAVLNDCNKSVACSNFRKRFE